MNSRYPTSVKHLVDLDEEALASARAVLGTSGIKDTVNAALAAVVAEAGRADRVAASLDVLATHLSLAERREEAWR